PDARPTVAEAAVPAVAAYVAGWLALHPDTGLDAGRDADSSAGLGAPCLASRPAAAADADARFVVVRWQVVCAADLARIALDFRAFFAVDARHEAIVTVHARDAPGEAVVVRAADPILRVQAGEAIGLAGWIAAGVDHIWEGRDHVSFVLALLLVVMLVRSGTGWDTRPPVATLRRTATIITAFTVAHSLSLIAASLGWVRLPSRLVESLIAVSILYTAIENIVRPDVRWRFVLTFGFGLVHGLGFASVLAVMLPPDHVIAPLLGFNVGVEVGQLVIVVIALPLAWLAARELGAGRYRRGAMPVLSVALAALAVKWLIERVFAVSLLTLWGM
ncbi:MAG TPA: HupE/UreJ family protein, partial [Kofleriaceae bacterium]